VLAGDNAVAIALAVKSLPAAQRRKGILAGAGIAVILRVILTFFAAHLLKLEFIELAGAVLILWIAIKLLTNQTSAAQAATGAATLRQAIWTVLVADITMSLDNILAIAAVSRDSLLLLIAGLGLSVSLVVFISPLLARMMDRFPVLIWLGAAILGRVAGSMTTTDPWIVRQMHPPKAAEYIAEACGAALVLLAGWAIRAKNGKKTAAGAV
jgi:YjbE family integral membrane protein